jgi:hypothetical protein
VFLNFGNWRLVQTKINIWSEGLAKLPQSPGRSWTGKWVSVTGLVDPPYKNRRLGYTHLSITVTEPNQLRTIEEAEARRRLASAKGSKQKSAGTSTANKTILKGIQTGSGSVPPSPPGVPPAPPGGSAGNQNILVRLRGTSPGSGSPQSGVTQSSPVHYSGVRPSYRERWIFER